MPGWRESSNPRYHLLSAQPSAAIPMDLRDQKIPLGHLPDADRCQSLHQALHKAVCQVTASNGASKCLYYALAGAELMTQQLGRRYQVQGGGIWFENHKPDQDGRFQCEIDPKRGWQGRRQYHAWIVCNHGQGRIEIADLTSPIYDLYAIDHGWTLPPPTLVWGWRNVVIAPTREETRADRPYLRQVLEVTHYLRWVQARQEAAKITEIVELAERDLANS